MAEQMIFRLPRGKSVPQGWTLVRLLGEETGLHFGSESNYIADVVLLERDVPPSTWQLPVCEVPMDAYEVANLRAGLELLRKVGQDTGDWLGQLLYKLPEVDQNPNVTVQAQYERVSARRF